MAVTNTASVANQIPEIWADDLYSQAEDLTFWHRFEGEEGSSMPVIRKDELEKEPGDTIRVDIILALTGAGVDAEDVLEGNEEDLKFRQSSFTVEALGHGVRWTKKAKILMTHSMRQSALRQLSKWLAGRLDNDIFTEFTGGGQAAVPEKNLVGVGTSPGTAVVPDDIAVGEVLTLDDITKFKAYAQEEIKIEPLRTVDSEEELFGMVLDPYAAMHLKLADDYQQAQREAQVRGATNPLFRGALAMWDGVVLFTNSRVPTEANATAVRVAKNVFFGAQALLRGYAYYPDWVEKDFDYDREQGVATYLIKGERLNTFDLNETETVGDETDDTAIGSLVVLTAAPAP